MAHTSAGINLARTTGSAPGRSPFLSGLWPILLCFCLAPGLAGCGGGPRVFNISSETYRGPELTVKPSPLQHIVALQAPSTGWGFTFDASRPQFGFTEVFLTITRPNPAFVYSQGMVTQEVGTEVEMSRPIVVYARILPHDVVADAQDYSRAIESGKGTGKTPAPR